METNLAISISRAWIRPKTKKVIHQLIIIYSEKSLTFLSQVHCWVYINNILNQYFDELL